MLAHIQGLSKGTCDDSSLLVSHGISASWHLSKWQSLDNFLEEPGIPRNDFDVNVGFVLKAFRDRCSADLDLELDHAREVLMLPLAAASHESYQRCYETLLRLHMLEEIQSMFDWSEPTSEMAMDTSDLTSVIDGWQRRLLCTAPAFRFRQPIFHLRNVLLGQIA